MVAVEQMNIVYRNEKKMSTDFILKLLLWAQKNMEMEFAYVKKMSTVFILPGFLSRFLMKHLVRK